MADYNLFWGLDGADEVKFGLKDVELYLGTTKLYPPQSTGLTMQIWVDDFPFDNMGDVIDEPEEYCGANIYQYTGDTFEYNGETYYLWETENADSSVYYLLTTTVDYNTLYGESMEDNITNTFDSAFIYLNEEQDDTYDFPHDEYQLIKVVDNGGGNLTCYIDDFFEDYLPQDWIDDPDSMNSKPFVLLNQTIEIDGDEYYMWLNVSTNDNDDDKYNKKYLLTTTNDYNTIYNSSFEASTNLYFDSFFAFLTEDGDTYLEGHHSCDYNIQIIKVEMVEAPIPQHIAWSDDFYGSIWDDEQDFIDDPESMGSNKYILQSETIEIDGVEYYMWLHADDVGAVKYMLTTTYDYDTLYRESLEFESQNTFDSFYGFLNEDGETYHVGDSKYRLIKIIEG